MPRPQRLPPDDDLAGGRAPLARENLEELVLALRLERRDAEDLPGRSAKLTPARVSSTLRSRTSSAVGTSSAIRIDSRAGSPSAPSAARATSGPSMYSTIFSSPPSFGTSVPTSRPSRRTVALSQCAITSREPMRDEEHRAAALASGAAMTAKTRSARSDGQRRRDLVQDQQLRVARERARQVEHAQQRQRHVGGLLGQVDVEVEVAEVAAHLGDSRCLSAGGSGRSSGPGRAPGSWKTGASPIRAACAGERDARCLAVDRDRAAVRRITPVRSLTSVLLPAPFAPSSAWTSPGSTTSVAERERDHRPVALRDLACGEEAHPSRRREGRRAAPLPSSLWRYGPLAADELRGRVRRPRLDEQLRAVRRRPLRRVVRLDRLRRRSSCPRPAASA